MTVKNLFEIVGVDTLADVYVNYSGTYQKIRYDDSLATNQKKNKVEKCKKTVRKLLEDFCKITIKNESEMIVFCVAVADPFLFEERCCCEDSTPFEVVQYTDVFAVKSEDIMADYRNDTNTYSMEFTSPGEILGYNVSEMSRSMFGDLFVAAAILHEMTFNGYTLNEIDRRIEDVYNDLEQSRVEEGEKCSLSDFLDMTDVVKKEEEDPTAKKARNLIQKETSRYSKKVFRIIVDAEKRMRLRKGAKMRKTDNCD